jgi:hypothetical protein
MNCSVAFYFCDFAYRDQQKPLDVLQSLLRQLLEQGDADVVSQLKSFCADPSKLRSAKEVAEIFSTVCSLRRTYLVIDALDEADEQNLILSHLQPLINTGTRILVMSRDLPNIRKRLDLADKMHVKSDLEDVKTYVKSRFRDSGGFSSAGEEGWLIDDVAAKAGDTCVHGSHS